MKANPQTISLVSTILNLILGILKVVFGIFTKSIALVADGIHSSLDVISSFVTFIGLKTAEKPVDKKHPYGYFKAENIAGFFVTILLGITGIWIVFEAIKRFLGENPTIFSLWAILVIVISIIAQEVVARYKFIIGKKFQSLALIADAQHSQADVISSIGVLVGLVLIKYFSLADAIVALGIGLYILFETFLIGKEITESLLDVSNENVEERIRKICRAHQIEISDLKTRKIGNYNFAELKIKLPSKLKVEEVGKIIKDLEGRFLKNIPELKYIVISIEPYDIKRTTIKNFLGRKFCEEGGLEKIGPRKVGKRIVIPVEGDKIAPKLGAREYLLIDIRGDKIVRKLREKNPYFQGETPKGVRFIKACRADKVITSEIGDNAKQNLENFNIEVEFVKENTKIEEIIKKISEELKK